MELIKNNWTKKDINNLQTYLKSLENKEKKEWCTNILKTEMPLLALKTPEIKKIASEIAKGNYISYLDYMVWEYYENTVINGSLITKIKDVKEMKHYLDIYSNKVDNWASCDLLDFKIKDHEKEYIDIVKEYIKSDKPFKRRIGIVILFNFVKDEQYIYTIFNILDKFQKEEHYYVNMINAWLFSECFIRHRDKTLKYLQNHKLNKFTINKGIQKCRDSYRVSKNDKKLLLNYKVK